MEDVEIEAGFNFPLNNDKIFDHKFGDQHVPQHESLGNLSLDTMLYIWRTQQVRNKDKRSRKNRLPGDVTSGLRAIWILFRSKESPRVSKLPWAMLYLSTSWLNSLGTSKWITEFIGNRTNSFSCFCCFDCQIYLLSDQVLPKEIISSPGLSRISCVVEGVSNICPWVTNLSSSLYSL